jgi:spermidine synthase
VRNRASDEPEHTRVGCAAAAFLAGAVVLVQELLAAGWLAPLFGAGIDVWGAILGTTLFSMAAGYFVGSFSSDRIRMAHLVWLLVAASISIVLCTFGLRVWLSPRLGSFSWVQVVYVAALVLGAPIFLLAVASPWLVELYSRTHRSAGHASGVTYAISTLGGVVGALLTGFWWVPFWGLTRTTMVSCWILAAAGLACVALSRRPSRGGFVPVAVLVSVLALAELIATRTQPTPGLSGARPYAILAQEDSWYGRREVYEDDTRRLLTINGVVQTQMPKEGLGRASKGSLLAAQYMMELVPLLRPEGREALIIGLGGGLLSSFFTVYDWNIETVEIDPGMLRLARQYFGFEGSCAIVDARRFLRNSGRTYDFILMDVYRGEDFPGHVATLEFYELVRARLERNGVFAINLISSRDGPDTGAILRTLREAFPHMVLFSTPMGPDVVFLTPIVSETPLALPPGQLRFQPESLDAYDWARYEILTDDRNPVALLRRPTAHKIRQISMM